LEHDNLSESENDLIIKINNEASRRL